MMQLTAVPQKLVDVSALPIKDGKARRLFIFADGKRSLAQIFNLCNIVAEEGFELVTSMLEGGHLQLLNEDTPVTKHQAAGDQKLVPVADFINGLTAELAKAIGPVASIVVEDFDFPPNEIDFGQRLEIINSVMEEIDDKDDKRGFWEAVQSADWY